MQQIYNGFTYIQECWQALIASWWVKAGLGALGSLLIWLIELKHTQVLGIFVLLVFIDLLTKWASISYQMLLEMGAKPENISVATKWQAIPLAFEKKLISSAHMRKPFGNKVLTYVALTISAAAFDAIAGAINGQSNFAVNGVWLYLGGAEFLSVLENLRDGGNGTAGRFLELVKSKIEAKVKI